MTTEIGGKTVTVGAIAKGSGMIHPNMGTMLCAVTTDCAIDGAVLQDMLRHIVTKTFNRITVDGDTSTNDTCVVLANGLAGNAPITGPGADYDALVEALRYVCEYEAKMIASDGEGARPSCDLHRAGRCQRGAGRADGQGRRSVSPGQVRHLRHRRQLGPGPVRRGLLRGRV